MLILPRKKPQSILKRLALAIINLNLMQMLFSEMKLLAGFG